ncbi:MAG: hypothetical protein NZ699_12800 [Roseiflexus sp.]|nr:hypothetical protein [Roseiflexus sp.]
MRNRDGVHLDGLSYHDRAGLPVQRAVYGSERPTRINPHRDRRAPPSCRCGGRPWLHLPPGRRFPARFGQYRSVCFDLRFELHHGSFVP